MNALLLLLPLAVGSAQPPLDPASIEQRRVEQECRAELRDHATIGVAVMQGATEEGLTNAATTHPIMLADPARQTAALAAIREFFHQCDSGAPECEVLGPQQWYFRHFNACIERKKLI